MKKVTLYTDGACSGNPGAGGWCAILQCDGSERVLSGGQSDTTNNRMELMAVICGLEKLKVPCQVDVYSDSAYVVNAFLQGWVSNWIESNWRTAGKKDVQNVDLWKRLVVQTSRHTILWHKVKGHADNQLNNRCDKIARSEIQKLQS